jgi:hypothetical protein
MLREKEGPAGLRFPTGATDLRGPLGVLIAQGRAGVMECAPENQMSALAD